MKRIRFKFWIIWLKTVSVLVVGFGLFMALSSIIPREEPTFPDKKINISFFPETEALDQYVLDFQSWLYGVGASMLVGWGVLMYILINQALSKQEIWARNAILVSILCWFTVDETISLLYGVTFNVIFNIAFLILFLTPVIFLKPHLKDHGPEQI